MAMARDEIEVRDCDLIARAQGGDRLAFATVVERHYDFIFRLAYRLAGNRTDAEDIAQEVCIRLARAIRSYRGGGAFTTWLYAVVLNAARDTARKSSRETAKTSVWAAEAQVITADEMPEDDQAEAMWAAVRQLPDKQRNAVTLVYGEGLSHAQAADVMAVAEATVSWHIHEAKKRLKRSIRAAEDQ